MRTSQSPPHKKQRVGSVGEVEVEVGKVIERASTFGVSIPFDLEMATANWP